MLGAYKRSEFPLLLLHNANVFPSMRTEEDCVAELTGLEQVILEESGSGTGFKGEDTLTFSLRSRPKKANFSL